MKSSCFYLVTSSFCKGDMKCMNCRRKKANALAWMVSLYVLLQPNSGAELTVENKLQPPRPTICFLNSKNLV